MELITAVIYLAGNIFRICVTYQILKIIFSQKLSKRREKVRISAFIIYFIVISFEFLYMKCSPTVILISNIIGIMAVALTYKGDIKYKLLISIGILVINLICEDWAYRLLLAMNSEHIIMSVTIIANLLFFFVMLLIQKFFEYKNGENIALSEWILLMSTPIISIIFSTIVIDDCSDEKSITVGGICLLALNIFSFYLINHIIKMQREQFNVRLLEQQYMAYKTQLEILQDSEKEFASLRHDMKNHFLAIQQLAENENVESLKRYLDKLLGTIKNKKRYIDTGNLIIDSLLNYKLNIAIDKLNIKPIVKISIPEKLDIEESDISIILGNLLDNALNALEKCNDKKYFMISMKMNRNLLIISMHNTHNENIRYKNGKFITTQIDQLKHGIGLNNVRRVVEKYSGQIHTEYTDDEFKIKIIMYM